MQNDPGKIRELPPEALSQIAGGNDSGSSLSTVRAMCPKCKTKKTFDVYPSGRAYCRSCNYPITAYIEK